MIRGNLKSLEDAQRNLAEMAVVLEPDHIEDAERIIAEYLAPISDILE